MKTYYLTLDLIDNEEMIKEYEAIHKRVQPHIIDSIRQADILNMELYRFGNRLFMVMETGDDFTFEKKNKLDRQNEKVQEWENLMWKFQQPLPGAKEGEKWMIMDNIFKLTDY